MVTPKKQRILIDIGNSNTLVFVVNSADELIASHHIPSQELQIEWGRLNIDVTAQFVIASVVPKLDFLFQKYENVFWVTHDSVPGLKVSLDKPEQLGADRIVTAVAAYALTKQSCLVIDSGTALTFCKVSKTGVYEGGAIFPGMRIASQALNDRTAKIPLIYVTKKEKIVGKTTQDAVEIGLYHGYIALINGMIQKYRELDSDAKIIGTGSGLKVLKDALDIDIFEENLIMDGLKQISELI